MLSHDLHLMQIILNKPENTKRLLLHFGKACKLRCARFEENLRCLWHKLALAVAPMQNRNSAKAPDGEIFKDPSATEGVTLSPIALFHLAIEIAPHQ